MNPELAFVFVKVFAVQLNYEISRELSHFFNQEATLLIVDMKLD